MTTHLLCRDGTLFDQSATDPLLARRNPHSPKIGTGTLTKLKFWRKNVEILVKIDKIYQNLFNTYKTKGRKINQNRKIVKN